MENGDYGIYFSKNLAGKVFHATTSEDRWFRCTSLASSDHIMDDLLLNNRFKVPRTLSRSFPSSSNRGRGTLKPCISLRGQPTVKQYILITNAMTMLRRSNQLTTGSVLWPDRIDHMASARYRTKPSMRIG